ncbi:MULTISPECIES: type II toxin-antitoxin system RelE/ParE family toxin [Rahnella]|jgi:hypothetical protein|uniref:Type II toxin-antitoxin system RelE/ParE family toxin n=1 Tax=Rahnella victoriana TaxID=1510570 RepID=A0ABS0DLZ9_9GAMM|nr:MULTISPECIES: type II toxin-antitoxin system RelE/ParE family toxin [Rahnella]MBF7954645.1 type II toxin-antitoxin system RelE/ParE family toxin [Rahnella victoriana]PBI82105.1 hypothetical protein A9993_21320 [Rahnella victoriana]TDS97075.1 hypothetical protein EDF78_102614 [Rahnella sp. BIGb0236]UHM91290.1 type II toxin-antitoxin system RelE/ParE family toxin [Rahnella victoriana]
MNCLRIFVTEDFHDFMNASKLSEKDILKSAHELANGLFDADLSGNVYKKRIAPSGRSKSGFGRAVIAFRFEDKIFYIDGWLKNSVRKKGNEIPDKLLSLYKAIARDLLNFTELQLETELRNGLIKEVISNG